MLLVSAAIGAGGCRKDIHPPVEPSDAGLADDARDLGSGDREPLDQAAPLDALSLLDALDAATLDANPQPDAADDLPQTADAAAVGGDGPSDRGTGVDVADGPPPACGTEHVDVDSILGADGLAVGRDGTLYFTQTDGTNGWVGRRRPAGGAIEPQWTAIPQGAVLTGLAVDDGHRTLYVASASGHAIQALDLSAPIASAAPVRTLIAGLNGPDDVVLDQEGNLYVSEQGDRRIDRVTPAGVRTTVTRSLLTDGSGRAGPAGLAFGPGGDLFAGVAGSGRIYRLALAAGVEQTRSEFGAILGWGKGLVFDSRDCLYLALASPSGDSELVRIDSAAVGGASIVTGNGFSSLAFGRGALDCHDLYLAVAGGPVQRLHLDTPGPTGASATP